jgi:glyoxylase-like metal-dependent hydrolase (beta-lactamase superfamily II)
MADKKQPSGSISANLFFVKLGFVAMYLFDAGESLIAFDTGLNAKATLAELEKLRVDPKRVKHVLLTHSDRDHVGGLAAFPNAKVYLPKAEVAMLDHTTPRFLGLVYSKPLPVKPELLDENEILTIGSASIKCLSTPGHTVGSMSYLINNSVLVVGDILNLKQGEVVMDRGFMQLDKTKRRESILRLSQLEGISLLCTAHTGYSEDFSEAMKSWLSTAVCP